MKKRFNKEINEKLKDIFIFTKNRKDIIDYITISELVEDKEINRQELSFHLRFNYCMPGQISGKNNYWGLKIKINE